MEMASLNRNRNGILETNLRASRRILRKGTKYAARHVAIINKKVMERAVKVGHA